MSDSFGFLLAIAAIWLTIGVVLSLVMGRRGYNGFGWLVLGTVLGPLALVLAVDAWRHDENLDPDLIAAGAPARGPGRVDVLVGYDGSAESAGALDAVAALLGERLGRLTVATVVPYGQVHALDRAAEAELRILGGRTLGHTPELEILHGRPSAALQQFAVEGGFDLLAVGSRGRGLTSALLGSAATELAGDSKVPVLLFGGQRPKPGTGQARHDTRGLASTS